MTLKQLSEAINKLMKDKSNHHKEIIGDVRPGLMVNKIECYSKYFISIYDERQE